MSNGVELATAWVRIVPTVEGIQSAVAQQLNPMSAMATTAGAKAGGGFATSFGTKLKTIAPVLGGIFVASAVVNWVKDSVGALKEWQTINAQSNAVIASTGGVANVTAGQVHELAQSIEAATASQAEGIQEGANLLLTFKNVRNEVGAGNDIFNQTVVAFADMKQANPAASMTMLGKAMNDPVAGLSALARVGVQFTDQQKNTIKALVDTGQTMEAQKLILAELNAQYGGSGAAYAETYAGKLYLFGDAVGDLGEKIMTVLIPPLTNLAIKGTVAFGWVGDNLPLVASIIGLMGAWKVATMAQAAATAFQATAQGAAFAAWSATNSAVLANTALTTGQKAATIAGNVVTGIATAMQWKFNEALTKNPIGAVIMVIALLVTALVYFFTQTELGKQVWTNVTTAIGAAMTWLWESVLQPVFAAIGAVFTWIYENVIRPIVTGILIYVGIWAAIFTWLWETILAPIFTALGAIFTWLYENVISPIITGILIYVGIWAAIFTWLWEAVLAPVFAALGAIFTWLWESVISPIVMFIVAIVKTLGAIFGWLYEVAVKPVFDLLGAAFAWLWTVAIKPVFDFISSAVSAVGNTVSTVFGGIADFIGGAFQSVLTVVRGPLNSLIDLINGVIGGLNSISVTIPDWVPDVGGQTFGFNIPTIPKLAKGGIVMPRPGGVLSLLAERNKPEVVLPLDRLQDFGLAARDDSVPREVLDALARSSEDDGPLDLSPSTIDALANAIAQRNRLQTRMGEA